MNIPSQNHPTSNEGIIKSPLLRPTGPRVGPAAETSFSPGDFDGDGNSDILAPGGIAGDGGVDIHSRDRGGYLHEYSTDGQGNWKQPSVWKPGWAVMSEISGGGSYEHNLDVAVNGGHPRPGNNVIAINQDGDLLKHGGRFGTQQMGNGWHIFTSLI